MLFTVIFRSLYVIICTHSQAYGAISQNTSCIILHFKFYLQCAHIYSLTYSEVYK